MARSTARRNIGKGKVLLVPPMEPYGARLLAAVFRSVGFDAYVPREDEEALALGLKYTSGGECAPCPATLGTFIQALRERNLKTEQVALFMPTACGPCRFGQYAFLQSRILDKLGWAGIKIMSPSAENAYDGLPQDVRMRMWHAIVVSDCLRKMEMRVRPYEVEGGQTDRVMATWFDRITRGFEQADIRPVSDLLREAVQEMAAIPRTTERKPRVGVVGEIYVRCDPFLNGNLVRRIEELGGEAMLSPAAEWVLYSNYLRNLLVREQGNGFRAMVELAGTWLKTNFFFLKWEHHYYGIADALLHDRREPPIEDVMEAGQRYLPWEYGGESILTLGRARLYVERDGCKAIVNASPMFCMPGTVTTSIFPKMEKELGVPIVCNFYDGSGDPNRSLLPVMHYLCEAEMQGSGHTL